jgi:enediyne biosynthesis protein E7
VLASPPEGPPDDTSLARLDLANRTMRETLRLHPAGVLSPRRAMVDLDANGHHITRGTMVLWSAHLSGRDPTAWPDPLRFDPDRFANLDAEARALADQAWVPFGRGARTCIGFALAQMELTLIVARLAQRLTVEADGAVVPRPVGMVVNRPEGGAPLWVQTRAAP